MSMHAPAGSPGLRMIERQSMADARAAVVADHRELPEAESPHQLDLIQGERTLRVVDMVLPVRQACCCRRSRADRALRPCSPSRAPERSLRHST